MTPVDYAMKYHDLLVPVVVDEKVKSWQKVKLSNYVLIVSRDKDTGVLHWDSAHADNQAAHDAMLGKLWEHFGRTNEKGAKLTVHVNSAVPRQSFGGGIEHREFDAWQELWHFARKAFYGKGSPEECQITLQLAERFKLPKGGTVQGYCDKYLGLDCNGFVGNYLVHGRREQGWDVEEPKGQKYLANTTIGVICRANGAPIQDVDELVPVNSYVMGLVGPSGNVIEQIEGNSFGHIFVTQPNYKWESAYKEGKTERLVPTMFALESTGGGVGLINSAIQIVNVKQGIFTIKRFSHPMAPALRFRAYRVI